MRQKMSVKKASGSLAVALVLLGALLFCSAVWKRHVLVHDGTPWIEDYVRRNLIGTAQEGRKRPLYPRKVEVLEVDVSTWRLLTTRRYRALPIRVVVRTDVHAEPQELTLQFRSELGTYRLVREGEWGY